MHKTLYELLFHADKPKKETQQKLESYQAEPFLLAPTKIQQEVKDWHEKHPGTRKLFTQVKEVEFESYQAPDCIRLSPEEEKK